MIVPVIISASLVIVCLGLILNKLKTRPILKKFIRLNKNNGQTFSQSLFVISNNEYTIAFLKNLSTRLMFQDKSLDLQMGVNDFFVRYYGNLDYLKLYYINLVVSISQTQILFTCSKSTEINIKFKKPDFQYFINSTKKTITIISQSKLIFTFLDFLNFEIVQSNTSIEIKLIAKNSCIQFNQEFFTLNKFELSKFKRRYFGNFDIASWEFLPDFQSKKQNILQTNYQKQLLNEKEKQILIPNKIYNEIERILGTIEIKKNDILSLTKLGLSKLVLLKKQKNKIILLDLLTNLNYEIVSNQNVSVQIQNIWQEDFLVFNCNCVINILFMPKYINNEILRESLIIGTNSTFLCTLDTFSIFDNLNRLLLHGVYIDLQKLFLKLNTEYLPSNLKLSLANNLLLFMIVFSQKNLINNKTIKRFLLENLIYATKNLNYKSINFIKNIIPFIQDKDLYNKLLELVLNNNFTNKDYEAYFTNVLGIRLQGEKLFIKPVKNIEASCFLWLKGHLIELKINKNWQILKVDNLALSGIDSLNLNNFGFKISLIFE